MNERSRAWHLKRRKISGEDGSVEQPTLRHGSSMAITVLDGRQRNHPDDNPIHRQQRPLIFRANHQEES